MSILPRPRRHVGGNADLAVVNGLRSWVEEIGDGIRRGIPGWVGRFWSGRAWVICGGFRNRDIMWFFDGLNDLFLLLLDGDGHRAVSSLTSIPVRAAISMKTATEEGDGGVEG